MAKQMVTVRLEPEVLERVDERAASRGMTRSAVLTEAFAEAAPEPRITFVGVGECPERDGNLGHVWASAKEDPERPCVFCGTPGRCNPLRRPREGNFAVACAARTLLFSTLRCPESGKAFGKKAKA